MAHKEIVERNGIKMMRSRKKRRAEGRPMPVKRVMLFSLVIAVVVCGALVTTWLLLDTGATGAALAR